MGIITKEVEIKLWGKNVKYYNNLGYSGKHGDTVVVKVEDLQSGSNVKIQYLCDYCKEEVITIAYADLIRRTKELNKMACKHCTSQKLQDIMQIRYGVDHYSKTQEYKEKWHKTCLERYGDSYRKQFMNKAFETFYGKTGYSFPSQSPEVREKMSQSYIEHYGIENYDKTMELRERTRKTNLERYGYVAPSQSPEVKEKTRITNLQKYGVPYTMQSQEVREKANKTLHKNGTQKTSKQQLYLHSLYGGEINYSISYYATDICFPEEKLVIEYDGGGHDLRVTLGRLTQEEFNQKEIIRSKTIKKQGYKQMRIISSKDLLPSDQTLLQMLFDAHNYFSIYPQHSWIEFNIDTSSIRSAEYKEGIFFDYGELRKITNS